MDDRKKIGIGLTTFGIVLTFLGVLMFFDRSLIAMGNILFISGVVLTIGPPKALKFFLRQRNHKGSAAFLLGFLLVLWGWAFIGIAVEGYGFVLLFGGFIPTVLIFLKKIPYLGAVLDSPFFKNVVNRIAPMGGLPL